MHWDALTMTQVTQRELGEHLQEMIDRLAEGGDAVLIEDKAVMMSAGEYHLLREIEDRLDLAAMAKAKAESEGTIPYEEARKELGL
jgi:PHD/YefM family antitoxin component YafN of YafNO toxin-antitoxin module